jgi:hypothetical protein
MPDYSKLHDLVSHKVCIEYDTGARITGYLSAVQPASGRVEFAVLSAVKMIDSQGRVMKELDELTVCPNVLTGVHVDEGPRGRENH